MFRRENFHKALFAYNNWTRNVIVSFTLALLAKFRNFDLLVGLRMSVNDFANLLQNEKASLFIFSTFSKCPM